MRLRWDVVAIDTNDILDIQVFAIEMVYVPEGTFFVGGGLSNEANKFYTGSTITCYQVTSENAITVSSSSGNLYYNLDIGNGGDQMRPIPQNFPKGFQAYYTMKYEGSQGQFVSFFNTITHTHKITNDITGPNGKNTDDDPVGNTVSWFEGSSSATVTTLDVSLNYLNNTVMNAYLDWAGLRYMTELEYEKSCREPIPVKEGKFA